VAALVDETEAISPHELGFLRTRRRRCRVAAHEVPCKSLYRPGAFAAIDPAATERVILLHESQISAEGHREESSIHWLPGATGLEPATSGVTGRHGATGYDRLRPGITG
jgi:hypothetical protein